MQLGAQAVFVGSGIFKSGDATRRAEAIVRATTHWQDPKMILEASRGLGPAMESIETGKLPADQRFAPRGW
jgi:pyridoxal 5'-phosphate synthase pdxS subunit